MSKMSNENFILPFILNNKLANGKFVKLTSEITKILSLHKYPDDISTILAEFLIISSILGHNLKSDGIITCQFQAAEGYVKLIVAECRNSGEIRGYAEYRDENKPKIGEKFALNGILLVTIDNAGQRYQGYVEVVNGNIADSFSEYFKKSEQILTSIKTSVIKTSILDEVIWIASGILIKQLPNDNKYFSEEEFNRLAKYLETLTDDEFISLSPEEILYNLFHEDGIKVFDKYSFKFKCTCSREKIDNFLMSLDEKQKDELKEDGKITIKCLFCNKDHIF